MKTQVLMDNQNNLYISYNYINFGFGPGEDKPLNLILKSTDLGETWQEPVLFDTNFYYSNLSVTPDGKFVRFFLDLDGNLYVQSTRNFRNWSQVVKINDFDSSVVEGFDDRGVFDKAIFENKLYTAWIDRRLPSEEIFYGFVDLPEISSVKEGETHPAEFVLMQNYPNPFNPTTVKSFQIPIEDFVTLEVFDVLGNRVKELFNGYLKPGTYKLSFIGDGLTAGIYFYRFQSTRYNDVKKMTLVK